MEDDSAITRPSPIDALPNEILRLIAGEYIDDPHDLGACLLAWRGFHVLDKMDLAARRCRRSTLLSLCAAGDLDGLRYVAARPAVLRPVPGFRWDACLYAAAIRNLVDVLDYLKAQIIEIVAASPPAVDPAPRSGPSRFVSASEMRALATDAQTRLDSPTWPLSPMSWLALAVGAAHSGSLEALGWLCADGNRPSAPPTVDCVLSVPGIFDESLSNASDALIWLRVRLDLGVAIAIKQSCRAMDKAGMHAIAKRIADASGFDIVSLLDHSITSIQAERHSNVLFDGILGDYFHHSRAVQQLSDETTHLADTIVNSSDPPDGALDALKIIILRGGLGAMRARHGDDRVAATLRRYPRTVDQILRTFTTRLPLYDGVDAAHNTLTKPAWPSLWDDAVWIHIHAPGDAIDAASFVRILYSIAGIIGRRDLMDQLRVDKIGIDDAMRGDIDPYVGRALSALTRLYPLTAIGAIARGDLETARWACKGMNPHAAFTTWDAWRAGDIKGVAFLYAHGCDRVPGSVEARATKGAVAFTSPLYEALRRGDTASAAILLDPAAADRSYRQPVDHAIAEAVGYTTAEALADGNLRVVEWLRRRYKSIVERTIAQAQGARIPSLIPVCPW